MANKSLPVVPTGITTALKNYLYGIERAIEKSASDPSNPGTDAGARASLQRLGKDLTVIGNDITSLVSVVGNGVPIDLVNIPPTPASFYAIPIGDVVGLKWTRPESYNVTHTHTEIYRRSVVGEDGETININDVSPLSGESYYIGSSSSGYFADPTGYDQSYFYWIRFVSNGGVLGVFSDVVLGTTETSITSHMADLEDYITESRLASDLRANINSTQYGGSQPSTKRDGTALTAGDLFIDDTGQVHIYLNGAWDSKDVKTDLTVITTEVASQLAPYALDDIAVIWYSGLEPTLTSHPKISVDDIWVDTGTDEGSTAPRFKLYTYTGDPLVWVEIVNEDLTKSLVDASTAQATADGKIQFFSSADDPNPRPTGEIPLGTGDIWFTPATESATSTLKYWGGSDWVDTLTASTVYVGAEVSTQITESLGYCEFTGADGSVSVATGHVTKTACSTADAGAGTGESFTWKDNGAFAQELKTVHTTVGANYATVQQDFVSKDGVSGKYSISMDVNGKISGFGLSSGPDAAGGVVSDFMINADNFIILGKDADGNVSGDVAYTTSPFGVLWVEDPEHADGGYHEVRISTAVIDTAAIQNLVVDGIANLSEVTIGGGVLTATKDANGVVTQVDIEKLHIDGANVDGDIQSTVSVADGGWKLQKSGTADFGSNVIVRGTLDAAFIKTNSRLMDDVHGYTMPLQTLVTADVPAFYWDLAWHWDLIGAGGDGYNSHLPGWAYNEYFDPLTDSPPGFYRFGGAFDAIAQTAEYDALTISPVPQSKFVGTSLFLPENNRFRSRDLGIKVRVSYEQGSGLVPFSWLLSTSGVHAQVRYSGYDINGVSVSLGSTWDAHKDKWMDHPQEIASVLGGEVTIDGIWRPPDLPANIVFEFGMSNRQRYDSVEQYFEITDPSYSNPSQLYFNKAWSAGPKVLTGNSVPAYIMEIESFNI